MAFKEDYLIFIRTLRIPLHVFHKPCKEQNKQKKQVKAAVRIMLKVNLMTFIEQSTVYHELL